MTVAETEGRNGVSTGRGNENLATFDPETTGCKEPDGLGIEAVFLYLDPCRKGGFIVPLKDRYCCLDDDGACVRADIHEMNGTAGDLHAVIQCLLLGVEPGKSGEQGRVDVHDRVGEGIDEDSGHDTHETGENHQVYPAFAQGGNKRGVIGFSAGEKTMIQVQVRNVMACGALQGEGIGPVADDTGDLRL